MSSYNLQSSNVYYLPDTAPCHKAKVYLKGFQKHNNERSGLFIGLISVDHLLDVVKQESHSLKVMFSTSCGIHAMKNFESNVKLDPVLV